MDKKLEEAISEEQLSRVKCPYIYCSGRGRYVICYSKYTLDLCSMFKDYEKVKQEAPSNYMESAR